MKSINIKKIEEFNNAPIESVSKYFDKNLAYNDIDTLNWKNSFPYKPESKFKIACSDFKLFIKFYVSENNIKAQYLNDMDPVCQDSCVEFFCKLPNQNFYYNFEINCIGTCLAKKRSGRNENVIPFTTEQFQQIERLSSLDRKVFEKTGTSKWTLTVGIPFSLIGFIPNENSRQLNANFYKCGDETKTPHYLSWNPIETENPDFHRPEYFGKLNF